MTAIAVLSLAGAAAIFAAGFCAGILIGRRQGRALRIDRMLHRRITLPASEGWWKRGTPCR